MIGCVVRRADDTGIAAAARALIAGRLVVHPTETVVSLSGDPGSGSATAAARRLKGYSHERPFLCLVADAGSARAMAGGWPPTAADLASTFWPGPLTLIVEAGPAAPAAVTEAGRLAVRPASDPVSLALLWAWGGPLFSTSANRRGRPAPVGVIEAVRGLETEPGFEAVAIALRSAADRGGSGESPTTPVREPAVGPALPSSIVDVTGPLPRLVRGGAIPIDRLRQVCPEIVR